MSGRMPKQDASMLSQAELRKELLQRKVKATGFWEEDAQLLQKQFDKEFDSATHQAQDRLQSEAAKSLEDARKKSMVRSMQREVFEEEDALHKRPDVEAWLELAKAGNCAEDIVFYVRPMLARHIAKHLPARSPLLSLDLSRNKLADNVGKHLGEMLQRNKSLQKLELLENLLGPTTAVALSRALKVNTKLRYLGLEGNPLTKHQKDFSGIRALATMLRENSTLTTINVRRCGIGHEGGRSIASAMPLNNSLIIFDMDYTSSNIGLKELQMVTTQIEKNKAARENRIQKQRLERLKLRKQKEIQRKIDEEKRRNEEESRWIEEQRKARQEKRRKEAEEKERQRVEDEKKREEERLRLDEETKKKAEEAAKSKRGKKKKSKKKK